MNQSVALTDLSGQLAAAQRQQQLAAFLQQQAQAPLEATGSYKGIQAPISPYSALAKMLQLYTAKRDAAKGTQAEVDIKNQQQQQRDDAVKAYSAPTQSDPGFTPTPSNIGSGVGQGGASLLDALKARMGAGPAPVAPMMSAAPQGPPGGLPTPLPPMPASPPADNMSAAPAPPPIMNAPGLAQAPAAPPGMASPAPALAGGPSATPPMASPAAPPADNLSAAPAPPPIIPEHATTDTDRQSMALQMLTSSDPQMQKIGGVLYSQAHEKVDEAEKLAKITAAIDDPALALPDNVKSAVKAAGKFGGSPAAASILGELVKPVMPTDLMKNFNAAQSQGYRGSIEDFAAIMNPKPVTVMPGGSYLGDARNPGVQPPAGAPPGAMQPQIGASIDQAVGSIYPGLKATSGLRSPAANAAAAGVPNSYHQEDAARDYMPPPGTSLVQMQAALKAKMGPQWDVLIDNHNTPHIHIEPGPSMGIPTASAAPHAIKPLYVAPQTAAQMGTGGSTSHLSPSVIAAMNEGRLPPGRVNSRTAAIWNDVFDATPGYNATNAQAFSQLMANANFQQKNNLARALPAILQNVTDAGKTLNFSSIKTIGDFQAFAKEQTNNPDFVNYMAQRADAIQTLTQVMRGTGATDKSIELELKAAPEHMSPAAFDSWYHSEMKALEPRLKTFDPYKITPPAGSSSAPAAGGDGWGKARVVSP